jgi:hypothetical protein
MLLQSVQSTAEEDGSVDKTLLESLVECYNNANHGLTKYRFNVARHHTLLHGRGSPVAIGKATRVHISTVKLYNQIIQDL